MMLYTRTPCGYGLGIRILCTGQIQGPDAKPGRVEIVLPLGCVSIVGYSLEKGLPKTPTGQQRLWVDPTDICDDAGNPMAPAALLIDPNKEDA